MTNQLSSFASSPTLSMSTREISELTGKRPADVMRDCRTMFEALEIDERSFASIYLDTYSREQVQYLLPKDLTTTLVSGYSIPMRHAIENRAKGQKFSEWVQEKFVGLTDTHDIADSIWYAENSVTVTKIPEGLSHPSRIRRWFNDQQSFLANTDPVLKEAPSPSFATKMSGPSSSFHPRDSPRYPLGCPRMREGGGID